MIKPETLTEMLEESIGSLDDFKIEVKGGDFVINDSVRIDLALLCEKLNAHNLPPFYIDDDGKITVLEVK